MTTLVPLTTLTPSSPTTRSRTLPARDPRGERRTHLLNGARAMAPWLLGVAPFGLVIGISATQADAPTLAGWLSGPLVFAGSAQVATIQLLVPAATRATSTLVSQVATGRSAAQRRLGPYEPSLPR